MEEPTKVCSRCGQEKPLTEFSPNKTCKDGHIGQCKKCNAEYKRKWYHNRKAGEVSTPPHQNFAMLRNPELANKTPRELIQDMRTLVKELRARGFQYEGKLTYLQTIEI